MQQPLRRRHASVSGMTHAQAEAISIRTTNECKEATEDLEEFKKEVVTSTIVELYDNNVAFDLVNAGEFRDLRQRLAEKMVVSKGYVWKVAWKKAYKHILGKYNAIKSGKTYRGKKRQRSTTLSKEVVAKRQKMLNDGTSTVLKDHILDEKKILRELISLKYANSQLIHMDEVQGTCMECGHDTINRYDAMMCGNKRCVHPENGMVGCCFHKLCVHPLDWSDRFFCFCCVYQMHLQKYQFKSGNKFVTIAELSQLNEIKCRGHGKVNGERLILFVGKRAGIPAEYYCLVPHVEACSAPLRDRGRQSSLNKTYNAWLDKYAYHNHRDDYRRILLPVTGFKPERNPGHIFPFQVIKNKANDGGLMWCNIGHVTEAIDPGLEAELVDFVCKKLMVVTYKGRGKHRRQHLRKITMKEAGRENQENPYAFFANQNLSIFFKKYSYKGLYTENFKSEFNAKFGSGAKEFITKLAHQKRAYEIRRIEEDWRRDKALYKRIEKFTAELNELIQHAANQYPEHLHYLKKIRWRCDGLAAFLLYCLNNPRHIDGKGLMDFAADPSMSSLFMLHVANNCEITFDEETRRFIRGRSSQPKHLCFCKDGLRCDGGKAKEKHIICENDSATLAPVPAVATHAHKVENIDKKRHTITLSFRALSRQKKEAQSMEEYMGALSLSCNKNDD